MFKQRLREKYLLNEIIKLSLQDFNHFFKFSVAQAQRASPSLRSCSRLEESRTLRFSFPHAAIFQPQRSPDRESLALSLSFLL
jgi:hypothetical protein